MAETDSTPPGDVANALLVELEAGAHFVDAGNFTLDPRKAREKLAAHQLAEPDRFVLLLVEAAHLLRGCTGVAFTIGSRSTKAVFEGVELRGDELHGCFDALFIDVGGLDPERARQIRGRQRLALALNTAIGLPNARVEMISEIAGEGSVRAVFDSDGRVHLHEHPSTSASSALAVEVHQAIRGQVQRSLLRSDARYATVPVQLDGVRIDGGPAADLVTPVEIRDAAGQVVGRAGWCAIEARRESGSVVFVANGVIVEGFSEPKLPPGLVALLDADDLQRDISQAKLRDDAARQQRIDAVAKLGEALTPPVPTLGPQPSDVGGLVMGVFCILVGLLLVVPAFRWTPGLWPIALLVLAIGLFIGGQGIWLLRLAHRRHHVRMHGHAGLGVVEQSLATGKTTSSGSKEMWLDMRIERAGQDGYKAALHTSVAPGFEHVVEPGKRLYVRIDRNDPRFAVFDAG